MILDITRLLLFPALMAFAAASDLFTMTISNRVSLALVAGFLALALLGGMGLHDFLMHLGAGGAVLVTATDDAPAATKIPYPPGVAPAARSLDGRSGRPVVAGATDPATDPAGGSGPSGFWQLDTRARVIWALEKVGGVREVRWRVRARIKTKLVVTQS